MKKILFLIPFLFLVTSVYSGPTPKVTIESTTYDNAGSYSVTYSIDVKEGSGYRLANLSTEITLLDPQSQTGAVLTGVEGNIGSNIKSTQNIARYRVKGTEFSGTQPQNVFFQIKLMFRENSQRISTTRAKEQTQWYINPPTK